MKKLLKLLVLTLCFATLLSCKKEQKAMVVIPTPRQVEWADAEVGVLINFDMPVYQADYNWRNFGTHPDATIFNPTELNTDQWLETAQKLGAKYAVLVAKHCSGFSLWPTEAHEYSIKNSPWKAGKGDIVADFVASCKKYNIKPGIYASTSANGYLHVDNPGLIQKGAPVTQEEYNEIVARQLTELWSNYGELFEIWFDGGVLAKERGGTDILSLVERLQPNAIAFQGPYKHKNLIRWVGNEKGVAPYPCWATTDSITNADGTIVIEGLNGDPLAPFWCPGESDFTLRWNRSFQGGWFWHADQDTMMFTVDELMTKYETSVGRNTNMLLGIVINDKGLVPEADVKRITEYGNAIQEKYGKSLSSTSGTGNKIAVKLNNPTSISAAIIQEDITKGERVLSYVLKGKKDTGEWIVLATGSNIGHKHIDKFPNVRLIEVSLEITKSKDTPIIKNLSLYK